MSTTNTTSGSNASSLDFNSFAQQVYNQFVNQGGGALQGYTNSPFANQFFNQGQAIGQQGAKQAGANNTAALAQNAKVSGITGKAGKGWTDAETAQTQRANQSMVGQANVSNILSAIQRQMQSAGTGLAFSPQLTGQSGQFKNISSLGGAGGLMQLAVAAGGSGAMSAYSQAMQNQQNQGLYSNPTGGSVGSTSNPGLMTPSYMPGGGSSAMAGDSTWGINPTGTYFGNQAPPPWLAGMGGGQS